MLRTESASIVMIIRVSGRPLKLGYGRPRYLPEISSMLCAPPSVVVAITRPRTAKYRRVLSGSTMFTATCGSRATFRAFCEWSGVLIRMCSPSVLTQGWVSCGEPSGMTVATKHRLGRPSRSSSSSGSDTGTEDSSQDKAGSFADRSGRRCHRAGRLPSGSETQLRVGWEALLTATLGVVVVALRKFDEGTCLIADSPGVMARGKEHHAPRREVLLRAVAQDHPQCARGHHGHVRQLALVRPGVRLQVLRPPCASLEGHLGNCHAVELGRPFGDEPVHVGIDVGEVGLLHGWVVRRHGLEPGRPLPESRVLQSDI